MYEADLAVYPANGWSLLGLAESLAQAGDRMKDAHAVHRQHLQAWQVLYLNSDSYSISIFLIKRGHGLRRVSSLHFRCVREHGEGRQQCKS